MDFYNEALKEAKKQNLELSQECKEIFLAISLEIQDLTLREKSDFLKTLIERWELN